MDEKPFVSFLVLNFNGREMLRDCLSSILAQTEPDFEVVLVDNGSRTPCEPYIPEGLKSRLRLIKIPHNLGFAGGHNRGIGAARADWIVPVSNDVALEPDFLAAFRREAGRWPQYKMFNAQVILKGFPQVIDATGLELFWDGVARCRGWQEDRRLYQDSAEVLGPSGSVPIIHREVFERVGLLDESFFCFAEDTDFALRAQWQGIATRYLPSVIASHIRSATIGRHSEQKAYLVERNHIWVAWKNFPLRLLLLMPFFTAFRYVLQGWAAMTGQGIPGNFVRAYSRRKLALILLKAYWDAFRRLPEMLEKRRRIRVSRKISSFEFMRILRRHCLSWRDFAFKD